MTPRLIILGGLLLLISTSCKKESNPQQGPGGFSAQAQRATPVDGFVIVRSLAR
jgi:hypothetical protein